MSAVKLTSSIAVMFMVIALLLAGMPRSWRK